MSSYGPYACWGYCVQLDEEAANNLEFTIQKLVEWVKPVDGAYEEAMEQIKSCLNFMDALDKAFHHFGSGIQFETTLYGHKITGYIYHYDPDYGGIEDCLKEGYYLEFIQDDLYEKKEKPALQALKYAGVEPTFSTWVNNS